MDTQRMERAPEEGAGELGEAQLKYQLTSCLKSEDTGWNFSPRLSDHRQLPQALGTVSKRKDGVMSHVPQIAEILSYGRWIWGQLVFPALLASHT